MTHSDILLKRIPEDEHFVGVEVGVFRGENAAHLLRARPRLHLILVDDWSLAGLRHPRNFHPQVIQAEARGRLAQFVGRHVWRELPSTQTAAYVSTCDFAFLDADHHFVPTLANCRVWWPKVTRFLAGHDYGHPDWPGVKEAVDAFALGEGLELEVEGSVWFLYR